MDGDGDILGTEIRITLNGGGILDLGSSVSSTGGNYTMNGNATQTTYAQTWSNTGYRIIAATAGFNITTLSEDFDESKPSSSAATGSANDNFNINITTRTNNEIGIGKSTSSVQLNEPDDDDDNSYGMSDYGILINLFDPSGSSEAETLTVQYPLSQRGARVFVTTGNTQTTKTSSGEVCTVADIQLNNVLDSEVRDPTQHNLIVVGGPCANTVTSDLFMACPEWTNKAGEGVLQMIANGDNVAMLVAGTNAADTRLASKVIGNYGDYTTDLTGKDKVIVGRSSVNGETHKPFFFFFFKTHLHCLSSFSDTPKIIPTETIFQSYANEFYHYPHLYIIKYLSK